MSQRLVDGLTRLVQIYTDKNEHCVFTVGRHGNMLIMHVPWSTNITPYLVRESLTAVTTRVNTTGGGGGFFREFFS